MRAPQMGIEDILDRIREAVIGFSFSRNETIKHIIGPRYPDSPGGSETNCGWELWVSEGDHPIEGWE